MSTLVRRVRARVWAWFKGSAHSRRCSPAGSRTRGGVSHQARVGVRVRVFKGAVITNLRANSYACAAVRSARQSVRGLWCAGEAHAHQLRVVLLQHARVVRVGVGHGDHRVALPRLAKARVVDASHADAERCKVQGVSFASVQCSVRLEMQLAYRSGRWTCARRGSSCAGPRT